MSQVRAPALLLLAALLLAGCSRDPAAVASQHDAAGATAPRTAASRTVAPDAPTPTAAPTPTTAPPPATTAPTPATTGAGPGRPSWLGNRPLPLRDDGFGQVVDTPPELVDRRLPPPETARLQPPPDGEFVATVAAVPGDVAARSTWSPGCPVALDDLSYVTVSFWGFDDRPHTGELLVHASAADGLVEVFRTLFEARFPIEEMRVVEPAELDAPPTGDGNNTTAFVCRAARGTSSWSQHAYGLAVDVNPFHNPYVRDDVVLPELASAYADRDRDRPGMVQPGGVVTAAFARIGWGWGGNWRSVADWMHFSATGR